MSSKRRSGYGVDSRKELHTSSNSQSRNAQGKLRMDTRPTQPRITDPSLPAGRRREIDTVMKKARSSPNANGYWDKKLLEVEAKDPNRWRHSGYKQMYVGGSSSPSPPPRHSRRTRSRSRSYGRRSPPPQPARAPRSARPRSPPQRPPPRRSPSASSVSSCSDDSCSVCSPKNRTRDRRIRSRSRSYSVPRSRNTERTNDRSNNERANERNNERNKPQPSSRSKMPAPSTSAGAAAKSRGRPRPLPVCPPSPPLHSSANRRPGPAAGPKGKPSDPRRAPVSSSRVRVQHEIIDLSPPPRQMPPVDMQAAQRARDKLNMKRKKERKDKDKVQMITQIKTERNKKRRRSPAPAESSGSEDSSSSSLSAVVQSTRLTLSERFGKMAQWSVDRRDIENMRITKNSNSGDLKVMIEEERMYETPPLRYSHSPAPIGHYPEELMATGPSGLAAWDDVRVRYQYYKDLGYLRDLSLDDYVKWEQWWYKYQEWLKNERYYEHWINSGTQNRRRRKRLPATQRLN